jgi:hypothetical protein
MLCPYWLLAKRVSAPCLEYMCMYVCMYITHTHILKTQGTGPLGQYGHNIHTDTPSHTHTHTHIVYLLVQRVCALCL